MCVFIEAFRTVESIKSYIRYTDLARSGIELKTSRSRGAHWTLRCFAKVKDDKKSNVRTLCRKKNKNKKQRHVDMFCPPKVPDKGEGL